MEAFKLLDKETLIELGVKAGPRLKILKCIRDKFWNEARNETSKASTASICTTASQFNSKDSTSSNDDLFSKVYELRTYSTWPDQHKKFIDMSTEWIPKVRQKYSKLVGYWNVEIGGLNQVIHIWEYDSLSHRAQVRRSLAADTTWLDSFVKPSFPCLAHQDTCLLELTHAFPAMVKESPDSDTYYYALLSTNGKFQTMKDNPPVSRIVGCYRPLIGDINMQYVLIQMESVDTVVDIAKLWKEKTEKDAKVKFMNPLSFSPLQ